MGGCAGAQADFIRAALDETVLELVASIAQHLTLPALRPDAHLFAQILQDLYRAFDPHTLLRASEDLLLARPCAPVAPLASSCGSRTACALPGGASVDVRPRVRAAGRLAPHRGGLLGSRKRSSVCEAVPQPLSVRGSPHS